MGKLKVDWPKVKGFVKGVPGYVKSNWHKNQNPDYDVSLKEAVGMSLSSMGVATIEKVNSYIAFIATSAVVGLVFGMSIQDIYILSSLGTVVNMLYIAINAQIVDNLGVLKKKTLKILHISSLLIMAILIPLCFVNSTSFDYIITDVFIHIAIVFGCRIVATYVSLGVYKFFSKKWGKFKPWIMFMGVPALICSTAIVFLPYQNLSYRYLLILVNLLSCMLCMFASGHCSSTNIVYGNVTVENMQNLITTNPQERVNLQAIFPIFTGLLRSVLAMFLPVIATLSGFEENSIGIYRIIVPLFGAVGLFFSGFMLWSSEKVVKSAKEENEVSQIELKRAFKNVFRNKYMWIIYGSTIFSAITLLDLPILTYVLLYETRMQWLSVILVTLAALPSTPGNLIAPFLTKRWSKRTSYCVCMMLKALFTAMCGFGVLVNSDILALVLITLFMALSSFVNSAARVIARSCVGDVWDYHQWKYDERVEGATTFFNYIKIPAMLIIGMLTPILFKLVGFVDDRDVLYDDAVRRPVLYMIIALYAIETIACTLPYFFFDLTPDKQRKIMADLKERARLKDELALTESGSADSTITASNDDGV